jgi:DNA-binding MarR family transcriptional regulator
MSLPPPDPALSAWSGLIRTASGLLEQVEADLAAAGFPPLAWYDVLLELRRAGRAPLRHRDLRARLLLAKHNLTRLLDRMEAEGLVERRPCQDDARGSDVRLTPKGRALQKRMWPAYATAVRDRFTGKLEPADIADLARALDKLG